LTAIWEYATEKANKKCKRSNANVFTSSFGQNKEMNDANGGLSLSYTSVPSIIVEMIGRTTVWPCSGWWRTNVAENYT